MTQPPKPSVRSPRVLVALAIARLAVLVARRLGRAGGVIGGRVLNTLAPDAARALAAGRRVAIVSGTNGKSTSTAMLTAALRTQRPVASNADGANIPAGLAWTLANNDDEDLVLEVDEAYLPWAIQRMSPHTVVLLNLARDQLHRNPEVGRLSNTWRAALAEVPVVVANADDPWVVWAAETAQRQVWVAAGQAWEEDSLVCPACGRLLHRDPTWRCDCGRIRPDPEWSVGDGVIVHRDAEVPYAGLPGQVNLSNAAMTVAAAVDIGVPVVEAAMGVSKVSEIAGRYSRVPVEGREVRLVLAKNPAGWQTALELTAEAGTPIVLAFNAEQVDGLDPSWLYDVDFASLRGRTISVCGKRASDLSVRLGLDDIATVGQYADLRSAVRALPAGPVELVATYSAFQQARSELSRAS